MFVCVCVAHGSSIDALKGTYRSVEKRKEWRKTDVEEEEEELEEKKKKKKKN